MTRAESATADQAVTLVNSLPMVQVKRQNIVFPTTCGPPFVG